MTASNLKKSELIEQKKGLVEQKKELIEQKKQYMQVVNQRFMTSREPVKSFQRDLLIKLKTIVDKLGKEFKDNGYIPKEYNQTVKNLISLTDKMRRQDEGIKMDIDMRQTHDEFRKIIDITAESMKGFEVTKKHEALEEYDKRSK